MRALFLIALVCLVARAGEKPIPLPEKTPDPKEAVDRLKAIEREVRSHQDESDEEVRKAKEKAKQIREEGERESARIKAEADAYTQKIQREIQDLNKKNGLAQEWNNPVKGPPTRKQLADSLAALVDPLMPCWEPRIPPSARPKNADVEKCVIEHVRRRLKGYWE